MGLRGPKPRPVRDRLKYVVDANGCWIWQGALSKGYGHITNENGVTQNAHRATYEALKGPIDPSLHLDHLCRNKACINPEHMEPVTPRVNVLRGVGLPAVNAKKTACLHGHPFSEQNTYWWRGERHCRTCQKKEPKPKKEYPCGTITAYKRGCRCVLCRGANALAARIRRHKIAESGEAYTRRHDVYRALDAVHLAIFDGDVKEKPAHG